MNNKFNNPIIFIPGLMGSMGNDIIEGTGEWSFGVARWIYDPLIDQLKTMNYELNENLFICYYDWRKQSRHTIEKYLQPLMNKVKKMHPNKKIDLICHSMGGIVARSYIQGWDFQEDIDKLILIGTPNQGAIEAYYLWSTGRLLPSRNSGNLYNIISRGYMWILQRLLNFSFGIEHLKDIHNIFPSIEELLPTWDYGDILCYEDERGKWRTVPSYYIGYKNYLLNVLNETVDFIPYKINDMYTIVGYNYSTPAYLMVDSEKLFNEGQEIIIDIVETLDGDGTVATKSAEIKGAKCFNMMKDHRKIVDSCFQYIQEIYGYESTDTKKIIEKVESKTIHIIFTGNPYISITNEDDTFMILEGGEIHTKYPNICEKYPKDHSWIVLKDFPKGNYVIKVDNNEERNINMLIMIEDLKQIENEEIIKAFQHNYQFKFQIF